MRVPHREERIGEGLPSRERCYNKTGRVFLNPTDLSTRAPAAARWWPQVPAAHFAVFLELEAVGGLTSHHGVGGSAAARRAADEAAGGAAWSGGGRADSGDDDATGDWDVYV